MKQHRILYALSGLFLLAAACGVTNESQNKTLSRYTVKVDSSSPHVPMAAASFFPNELAIHPGDTIDFKADFTGEPHTATFGTLVNKAVKAIQGLPQGRAATDSEIADLEVNLEKVPNMFPNANPNNPISQASAQPCFLSKGKPPPSAACRKTRKPIFNGKQSFLGSGWLSEGQVFTIKFSKNIKPGTYNFMCMVHREGMTGAVHVVSDAVKVQTPAQASEIARGEVGDIEEGLRAAVKTSESLTPDRASAGITARGSFSAESSTFAPSEASIPTGGTVSWTIRGFHTISINPSQDAVGALMRLSDGTVAQNPKAKTPSLAPPPPLPYQDAPVTAQATYDGEGFFNTGFLVSFPPGLIVYRITFTKPGTYPLQCLVHADMKGKVKVGS